MSLIEIIEYHSETISIIIRIILLVIIVRMIIFAISYALDWFNSIRLNDKIYSLYKKNKTLNKNKFFTKNTSNIEQTAYVCKELENYLKELSNLSSNSKKIIKNKV
jgi:hypothetical protein